MVLLFSARGSGCVSRSSHAPGADLAPALCGGINRPGASRGVARGHISRPGASRGVAIGHDKNEYIFADLKKDGSVVNSEAQMRAARLQPCLFSTEKPGKKR